MSDRYRVFLVDSAFDRALGTEQIMPGFGYMRLCLTLSAADVWADNTSASDIADTPGHEDVA